VVFNAVNIDTGDFYAVKRFAFNGKKLDVESLDSIEVKFRICDNLFIPGDTVMLLR
jgi:hypothetical protein